MILLIDSGATNSTWKVLNKDGTLKEAKSVGFNVTTSPISTFEVPLEQKWRHQISTIFFFGAGTGSNIKLQNFHNHLDGLFPHADNIYLLSDLHSAGFALSRGEHCIIGIIGTGSNCATFDKNQITNKINNLGFLLGDEGSGLQMGKIILRDFFYNAMPHYDHEMFKSEFGLTRQELLNTLYDSSTPANRYMASFSSFLIKSSADYRFQVAEKALDDYFKHQILQLSQGKAYSIHMSGSISYYFQDITSELVKKYNLSLGRVIQNPMNELDYDLLNSIYSK